MTSCTGEPKYRKQPHDAKVAPRKNHVVFMLVHCSSSRANFAKTTCWKSTRQIKHKHRCGKPDPTDNLETTGRQMEKNGENWTTKSGRQIQIVEDNRKTILRPHLGNKWKTSRQQPQKPWTNSETTSGKQQGDHIWETSRRQLDNKLANLGGNWEATSRKPRLGVGEIWRTIGSHQPNWGTKLQT